MRRLAMAVVLLVALIGLSTALGEASELVFQTGFHYDWWSRDEGSWGQQILIPYSAEGEIEDFSLKIIGGYAFTSTDLKVPRNDFLALFTRGEKRVTSVVSGVTDTKVNLSYDFGERLPVGLLVGLDFNVPTGETRFRNRQDRFLLLDPDLVSLTSLGEGFNINPSLIVSKEWNEHWATGLGFGYAWRGDYKRFIFSEELGQGIDNTPDLKEIDPGNVLTVTPEVRYYLNDAWHARFFFNYSRFWPQEVDGEDVFEPGDYCMGGIGIGYERAKWTSHVNLTAIFRGDPEIPGRAGFLGVSDALTHVNPFAEGDEVVAELGAGYALNDLTTLKSQLVFRYLYDTTPPDASFDPQYFISDRKLVSLQMALVRKVIPHLEAELTVKGLYMHDEESLEVRGIAFLQDRDYTGFSAGIKLTGAF